MADLRRTQLPANLASRVMRSGLPSIIPQRLPRVFGREHGQGIARAIQAMSGHELLVDHGSL